MSIRNHRDFFNFAKFSTGTVARVQRRWRRLDSTTDFSLYIHNVANSMISTLNRRVKQRQILTNPTHKLSGGTHSKCHSASNLTTESRNLQWLLSLLNVNRRESQLHEASRRGPASKLPFHAAKNSKADVKIDRGDLNTPQLCTTRRLLSVSRL